MFSVVARWFDSARTDALINARGGARDQLDWARLMPFLALHIGCLAVLWVGFSAVALAVCMLSYLLRMFAITGFYHRYFSHRSFQTSRAVQLLFAVLGAAATQRAPLWWASHHRAHHHHADQPGDPHRPAEGLLHAHLGWFLRDRNFGTNRARVRDWLRFPELLWLDRFEIVVPVLYAAGMYGLGAWLQARHPGLGTNGSQMLVWGYVISTVLLTLGEGWHNNHHRYPGTARQGFYWWQPDPCYRVLRLVAALGLVWGLRMVPQRILVEGRRA